MPDNLAMQGIGWGRRVSRPTARPKSKVDRQAGTTPEAGNKVGAHQQKDREQVQAEQQRAVERPRSPAANGWWSYRIQVAGGFRLGRAQPHAN